MNNNFDQLKKLDLLLNWKKRYKFSFNFKELSVQENAFWLKKVNENYNACGCNTGKIFTAISFLLILLYYVITFWLKGIQPPILSYIYTFLFLIVFSIIGKITGKLIAYRRLKKDIENLKGIIKIRQ